MNPTNARGLVPPRPNLGPEPWSEAQPIALYLWVGGSLACLLVGWVVGRRLALVRARPARTDLRSQGPRENTPRGRLVALSQSMRNVLADQFGTAWRAKTTEELSAEPRLLEVLGHDQLQELIRFLDQVDQLKFAPERSNHHHESLERELTTWEPRLADLNKKIQAKPERRLKKPGVRSGPRNSRTKIESADPATAARS